MLISTLPFSQVCRKSWWNKLQVLALPPSHSQVFHFPFPRDWDVLPTALPVAPHNPHLLYDSLIQIEHRKGEKKNGKTWFKVLFVPINNTPLYPRTRSLLFTWPHATINKWSGYIQRFIFEDVLFFWFQSHNWDSTLLWLWWWYLMIDKRRKHSLSCLPQIPLRAHSPPPPPLFGEG